MGWYPATAAGVKYRAVSRRISWCSSPSVNSTGRRLRIPASFTVSALKPAWVTASLRSTSRAAWKDRTCTTPRASAWGAAPGWAVSRRVRLSPPKGQRAGSGGLDSLMVMRWPPGGGWHSGFPGPP